MFFPYVYIFLFHVVYFQLLRACYNDEIDSKYGQEWLNFTDENGTELIMNFTLPADHEGLLLGDVDFYLYTRLNAEKPELLIDSNGSIFSKYLNPKNDIKVLTHGWRSNYDSEWIQKTKDALLKEYELNVFVADWSEIAKNIIYPWSALSTRYVGKHIAKLLITLSKTYNLRGEQFHLIGHSLGAQVLGHVGMYSAESQIVIHRITGLDPARPLFELPLMPPDFRLERSDAKFVDIIHTSGGVYGYLDCHGQADFFPNNGMPIQPGCESLKNTVEACSHSRSHELFEESISPDIIFIAYSCESWEQFKDGKCSENTSYMGYPASDQANGKYYLYTKNSSIYAI